MIANFKTATAIGFITVLSACAQSPTPGVIYAEPTFNKFGVPSCRPGDVPVGGIYTADLPICDVIALPATAVPGAGENEDETAAPGAPNDPDTPGSDPGSGGGNQNQNQNENQNTETNRNRNQGG